MRIEEHASAILGLRGPFTYVIRDKNGRVKARGRGHNAATTVGLNDMLNAYFRATTQPAAWYLGLINNSPAPALAAADTMASHGGWVEATAYSESVRQTWAPGAAASGLLTATATFTANGTVTIYGFFGTTVNTKGGTTGILFATAPFDTPQAMANADTIAITWENQLQAVA